ncbi:hypothetical protein DUK53_16810 [Listeria sp. SHR_NRA_18]|uniref:hypothetical protein n=1 Tax=Listeria sp. SHR_NRA_18 TaxID=2269046 RepID=UPI000F601C65|nr:hypothetical protein [Listeria sp. SHR_NRA_18]RQW65349.1 hypothetical protein DUK53_16810 [Listeria sp. SHR_NRA_18]
MKTVEFKQKVEALGYSIGVTGASEPCFCINNRRGTLAFVEVNKVVGIDTTFGRFEQLSDAEKQSLAELLFEYAATPLDEREEPKKWRIKCPITGLYLNKDRDRDKYTWSSSREVLSYQTQFTRAEIEAFTFEHAHLIEEEVTE